MQKRKYPIGIQTFRTLIEEDYVYVDKTQIIYNLVDTYRYAFMSRPRRFGKSLLVSTLKEYFEGNKELFKGLKIAELETNWVKHPVLAFNMSRCKHSTVEEVTSELSTMLSKYEEIYGHDSCEKTLTSRMTGIIQRSHAQTGQKVVILIDEYDAPLLNVLYEDNMEEIRRTVRSFYSPIKDCDEHIRFAFITGITKFSQLSIFSELNNLEKISMYEDVSAICGVTQAELDNTLKGDVCELAESLGLTYDETRAKLKEMYDGYHFSENSEDIYNPFSLLSCLKHKKIDNFWFDSATPTFLLKSIKKFNFRITDSENLECDASDFDVSATDLDSAIPLMYQSGYLTIKNYDKEFRTYTLSLPNREVKDGLLKSFYPSVFPNTEDSSTFWIKNFIMDIRSGNLDSFMERLESLVLSVPYATGDKAELVTEQSVQNAFFLIFNLMGQLTRAEVHTFKGRSDCIVETADFVYLFEFKLTKNGTAQEALQQIDKKDYACSFVPSGKKVVKVGVAFDSKERKFSEWLQA